MSRRTDADPPSGSEAPSGSLLPVDSTKAERQAAIVQCVRLFGMTGRSAALACGVGASTFYEWVDADSGFRDRIATAERGFEKAMLGVIVGSAIKHGSFRAAIAILERRFPDQYGVKASLDVHVDDERERERQRDMAVVLGSADDGEDERIDRMQDLVDEMRRRRQAVRDEP